MMDTGGSYGAGASETAAATGARRYTLLRRLAVGGMGELFLAGATAPHGVQKLVAIKRVRPEYASDSAFVAMFLNEARLAATLDHPNIVRTYDLVEEDGSFFMVMEYLHGESLGQLLNGVAARNGRVPTQQVLTIGLGMAAGLHSAHERRAVDGRPLDIVHRDLSPGNVFITYEGGVKLLDFGIAKATSRTSITIGPSRKGKVSYMSPEQCVGDDVDRRSDIFALGVLLWELCTAKRLFRGDNEFGIMNQITTIDAPRVDGVPEDLQVIVAHALARDRDGRFQTAMELHDALEAFAMAEGLMPSVPGLGRFLEETCGRREFPSTEPSAEFGRGATIVAPRGTADKPVPTRRRWSLVVALAGGATLGAVAVGATGMEADVAPPRPAIDADARHRPLPSPEPATADAKPKAQPEPVPAPEAVSAAPDQEPQEASGDEELESARKDKRRGRKRAARRKKKTADAPPRATPERGVDGLLPRG